MFLHASRARNQASDGGSPRTSRSLRSRRRLGFRSCKRSPCESHGEVLISPTGPRRSPTLTDPPACKPWGIQVVRSAMCMHSLACKSASGEKLNSGTYFVHLCARASCARYARARASAPVARGSTGAACALVDALLRAQCACTRSRASSRVARSSTRGLISYTNARAQVVLRTLVLMQVCECRGAQVVVHVRSLMRSCARNVHALVRVQVCEWRGAQLGDLFRTLMRARKMCYVRSCSCKCASAEGLKWWCMCAR